MATDYPPEPPSNKNLLLSLIATLKEDIFEFKAEFDENYSEFQRLELNREQVIEKFNFNLEKNGRAKELWIDSKSLIFEIELFAITKPDDDINATNRDIKEIVDLCGLDPLTSLKPQSFKFFIKAVETINLGSDYFSTFLHLNMTFLLFLEIFLRLINALLKDILSTISTFSNLHSNLF
jgi:hypothetical protein